MTNPIIQDFQKWTKIHSYWWIDDPYDFIKTYLEARDPLDPKELVEIEDTWASADKDDYVQAEEHLTSLLEALPKRPAGELIFMMTFLNGENEGAHVTLLGPTFFPSLEAVANFTKAAEDFIADMPTLTLTIGESESFTTFTGAVREVHLLEHSNELNMVHNGLVGLAGLYEGRLIESSFAGEGFRPHVTHDENCALESGSNVKLSRVNISLHPGARINVKHARSLGTLPFSG